MLELCLALMAQADKSTMLAANGCTDVTQGEGRGGALGRGEKGNDTLIVAATVSANKLLLSRPGHVLSVLAMASCTSYASENFAPSKRAHHGQKEKKRKDCAFWRHFIDKPSPIPGSPWIKR